MTLHNDEYYMRLALDEAVRADGRTAPNPIVGAIIVKDGKIIGRGYHKKCGLPHAEVEAINDAEQNGHDLKGTSIYITLEPCCHHGKTPPCTDAIIKAGISRVIYANTDPDPRMQGKSDNILMKAGIEVVSGVLSDEAKIVNEPFLLSIEKQRAFIAVKYASSMDGRIATHTGNSRWISSHEALVNVHRLRDRYNAILIGANTLRNDNPSLTVRHIEGRNPVRIVLAGETDLPSGFGIFHDNEAKIIVVSNRDNPFDNEIPENVTLWHFESSEYITIEQVARRAFENDIHSIMIEGGSKIITQALREKVVDRMHINIAPIIIGKGVPAVGNLGIETVAESIKLEILETNMFKSDISFTCKPDYL